MRSQQKEVGRGPTVAEDGGDEKNEVLWNPRGKNISRWKKNEVSVVSSNRTVLGEPSRGHFGGRAGCSAWLALWLRVLFLNHFKTDRI